MSRRALLTDLGRSTLAVAVLGVGVAACGDGDETGDGATGVEGAGAAGGGSADPTEASDDRATEDATEDSSGEGDAALRWERASMGFVSAYVLVRDGEALVLDTGTGEDISAIAGALEAAGAGWGDVSTVLVTHSHGDHAGGVAAVAAEAPQAVFLAATPDLDEFRDRVADAREVADGDTTFGDLRVVATPGHTAGHVSAFHPGTGLLLAGDAIVNGVEIGGTTGDGIEVSPPEFTADGSLADASVGVLAGLDVATILFGHGEPVTSDAAAQLRELADGL